MGVLSDPIYRPLSITFIEYREGDKLGFLLAWFSMLPFIYIVSLCTLILFRRDIQTIMYFGGFCISEVLNNCLKKVFKQARPERTRDRMGLYEVHGMPSDHAQTFFYFMTYLAIFIIVKSQMPGTPRVRSMRNRMVVFAQLFVATIVAYSRVYLHYHTIPQVVVGALIGTILGCVWYYFVNYEFIKYVPMIIEHPLARYFLLRDYSSIPRLIHFQYESEYAEAKRWRERRVKDQTSTSK
jgi:dolichyldiphosphatase